MSRRIRVVTATVLGAFLALSVILGAGRLLASTLATDAVAPTFVNYQGYVTDAGGSPISNTVTLVFRIWDASSGGNELWTENHFDVPVNQGYFSVFLGSQGTPLTPSVFSSTSRYIEVTFGATTFARQRFGSVPYALVATQASEAISSTYATTATYAMSSGSSGGGVEWEYVKVVAKSGGDYTSITEAMNAISPSSTDRYLIMVMPGVYEEQVTVKQYVHLKGSGPRTTIVKLNATGAAREDASAFVMQVPANSQVSDLAVINTGTANNSVGVRVEACNNDTLLDNLYVAVTGTAGSDHYALLVRTGSDSPKLRQVEAIASGATGTNSDNAGIFNNSPSTIIEDSTITAEGGDFTWGVRLAGGELSIIDSVIRANNGSDGEALSISGNSGQTSTVNRSSLTGDSSIITTNNHFVNVGASLLDGPAPNAALLNCGQSYDGNYDDLDNACQ